MSTRPVYKRFEAQEAVVAECRRRIDRWRTPHELRLVETTLGPTTILVAGGPVGVNGRSRPVLVLPGTNFAAAAALPLATAIARTRQVLFVDLPGQPGLSYPRRPPFVGAYGGWLDEVLGQLDRRPTILGHSLGAAIALLATPELAADLVLVNPAGFVKAKVTLPLLRATMPWLVRPAPHTARRLAQYMAGPAATVDDATVQWLDLVGRSCRPATAPAPVGEQVLAGWQGHAVRLLLGAADPFFPSQRVAAVADAHGFTSTVVDGAGHLIPEERPEAIVAVL